MLLQLHDAMCKARVFETAEGLKKAQKVKFAIYLKKKLIRKLLFNYIFVT